MGEFSAYAYTTRQGKRLTRYESRCSPCNMQRRAERYAAQSDKEKKIMTEWRAANREHLSAYHRKRQQSAEVRALKAYHQRLRKARLRANAGDNDEIREIYRRAKHIEQTVKECPVFDLPELGRVMHVDHIVPISKGGKHVAENLQILPIGLNMRKGVSIRA